MVSFSYAPGPASVLRSLNGKQDSFYIFPLLTNKTYLFIIHGFERECNRFCPYCGSFPVRKRQGVKFAPEIWPGLWEHGTMTL